LEFIGFLSSIGGVLNFVIALSIIVAVHEFGHYIVGRWSGIHSEVFSLGFGPALWSRVDKRGTRWQIAALPLGGYVKFLGDADAASAPDGQAIAVLSDAQRRRTMHGAPLWARVLTVAAGPVFNFIFAIVIIFGFGLLHGAAVDTPTIDFVKPLPTATESLRSGDRIVALAGQPTPDNAAFIAVADALPPAPTVEYVVLRDGSELTVQGPYPFPPLADGVQPTSAAMNAGLLAGDVITAIDGAPVHAFSEIRTRVEASAGSDLRLTVWRAGPDEGGTTFDVTLQPKRVDLPLEEGGFETRWLIGLTGGLFFQHETRALGLVEAATNSVARTWGVITTSLSFLGHIIVGNVSSCNLSGPIGIYEVTSDAGSQGIEAFIQIIVQLSIAVGLMNLFPIPVLDGGHLVFHAYEAVTGRPPSDRALRVLMGAGLVLLLALMTFALTNDVFCP